MRKGQAAVEYLVTYGWVFVVILAAIGALSYFDLLSPSQYLPTRCEFGQQLSCVDTYMDTDETMVLRFKNLFGADIRIVGAYAFDPVDEVYENIFVGRVPGGGEVQIAENAIGRVEFDFTSLDEVWSEGAKERARFIVEFRREAGTVRHNISGTVVGEVSEPLTIT